MLVFIIWGAGISALRLKAIWGAGRGVILLGFFRLKACTQINRLCGEYILEYGKNLLYFQEMQLPILNINHSK